MNYNKPVGNKLEKLIEEVSNLNPTDFCRVMHSFTQNIINRLQAENENLELLNGSLTESCDGYIKAIELYKAEIERLKPFEDKIAEFNSSIRVEDMLVFASSLEEWMEFCDNLKTEAYKECIEKVKAISQKKTFVYVADASIQERETGWLEIQEEKLDNLLKELEGDK